MKSIPLQIYSLTTESKIMSEYIHRSLSPSFFLSSVVRSVCVCVYVCVDECVMSEWGTCQACHRWDSCQKLPPLPSGTLSSSQSCLMAGYITTHTRTHAEGSTQQTQDNKRPKGGQTLSPALMDKERVRYCVQTFNRVTKPPSSWKFMQAK